jgi:hypothetical protein
LFLLSLGVLAEKLASTLDTGTNLAHVPALSKLGLELPEGMVGVGVKIFVLRNDIATFAEIAEEVVQMLD